MKEFLVKTSRQSCAIKFNITVSGDRVPVYITGNDPLTPNTFYFKSMFLITGNEEVTLNCPQSPIFLKINAWSFNNVPLKITAEKIAFEREPIDDPIIVFIEKFARLEGIYWPGIFYGEAVPFVIDLRRVIYNEQGDIHSTPARISTEDPVIQVSKQKFDQMSVPQRVIILLHEGAHNYINYNPDDEQEADDHAVSIYTQLGYPKVEAMEAFSDIMPDTDQNYSRMLNLVNI
jgi:hypothetical protein